MKIAYLSYYQFLFYTNQQNILQLTFPFLIWNAQQSKALRCNPVIQYKLTLDTNT